MFFKYKFRNVSKDHHICKAQFYPLEMVPQSQFKPCFCQKISGFIHDMEGRSFQRLIRTLEQQSHDRNLKE